MNAVPARAEAGDRRRHRPVHPVHRVRQRRLHRKAGSGDPGRPSRSRPTAAQFVFLIGLIITIALYVLKIRAALIISILATTVVALIPGRRPRTRRDSCRLPPTSTSCPASAPSASSTSARCSPSWAWSTAVLTIFAIMLTRLLRHDGHRHRRRRRGRPDERGRNGPRRRPGPGRRLRRGDGRRHGRHVVEHDLHRERGGRRRGRPDRLRVGRDRRPASCSRSSCRRSRASCPPSPPLRPWSWSAT